MSNDRVYISFWQSLYCHFLINLKHFYKISYILFDFYTYCKNCIKTMKKVKGFLYASGEYISYKLRLRIKGGGS